MIISENQFLYSTGKLSSNNLYDISLKTMEDPKICHMEIFSLSRHMYHSPESKLITQSSSIASIRTLDKKGLLKLQKDLYKMASKIKRYRKYGI